MRNLLKCLLAVALVAPVMAFAGIRNSKHDLTFTGNSYYITGNPTAELCAFCHIPHNAPSTKQLWNRAVSPTADGWLAGNTTSAGTPLPTQGNLSATSKQCLSCHDGGLALAAVSWYHGVGPNTTIPGTMNTNATLLATSYAYMPADFNAAGNANHPVSVPMGNGVSYNGIVSAAPAGQYAAATTTCSGVSLCPNNTTPNANQVRLYGTQAAPGIECGSCHEPHLTANSLFLRISNASSALCLACHIK